MPLCPCAKKSVVNSFSMRHDGDNELLTDAIRVIYLELSKLGGILKKDVGDMTDLEKWAVFFRYADKPARRKIVNRIIETKEALQMAGELLMSVSQDERERAVARSRRMFQTDMQSDLATAEDLGMAKGIAKGRAEGRREGKAEGELAKALDIARKMIKRDRPIDEIIEDTGLSREEVENLRV